MKYRTIIAAMLMAANGTQVSAQDNDKVQSLKDIDFLIGTWSLVTNYANGAKASGSRSCSYALHQTRIRCVTESLFSDQSARDLEVFYSYNASAENFTEVAVYQRPIGNKVADLTLDKASGTLTSRGYIYAGDGTSGPRVSEEWITDGDSITMTMRLNRGGQPAHVWPVFITETMTRKQ